MTENTNEALGALVRELQSAGLVHGFDFYVVGVDPTLGVSSEFYGLTANADGYEVYYHDMGCGYCVLQTPDFAEARARLVMEAVRLAGGRGRGPKARTDMKLTPWSVIKAERAAERATREHGA